MNLSKKTIKKFKREGRFAYWKALFMSEITGWDMTLTTTDPIGEWVCSRCGECTFYEEFGEPIFTPYCAHCGAYIGKVEGGTLKYIDD